MELQVSEPPEAVRALGQQRGPPPWTRSASGQESLPQSAGLNHKGQRTSPWGTQCFSIPRAFLGSPALLTLSSAYENKLPSGGFSHHLCASDPQISSSILSSELRPIYSTAYQTPPP